MNTPSPFGVYGAPPAELAEVPAGALQLSPRIPGSADLETLAPQSLAGLAMSAPPGTVERRAALALALRALRPGASLTVMAPKDRGGSRLGKELAAFGCRVEEHGQRHQRICHTSSAPGLTGLDEAIAAGAPRPVAALDGLWSQPGLFSWDRLDPGTALLLSVLPPLAGRGADLGCGVGVIARQVLAGPEVAHIDLIDHDARAVAAARRNVEDPRATIHWADVRYAPALEGLDFVVTNPPFHDGGPEDRALGQAFLRRARDMLVKGGVLWVVANRHLPYEATLAELFATVTAKAQTGAFKVYEARR